MKYFLFRLILLFIISILFFSNICKGKKALINYNSQYYINSIKIEPEQKEYFFKIPIIGIGNFYLDCEPGDKINLNITLNKNHIIKNEYFYIEIIFDDKTKYFFDKNNLTTTKSEINNKKFIYIYFYIPFETYCKDKNNINIYNNSNDVINIDLTNYIFIKNKNIQSIKRLSLNITEIFPLNTLLKTNKNIITIYKNNSVKNIKTPITIKYTGISNTGKSNPLNECSLKINYNNNSLYKIQSNNIHLRKLNDDTEEGYYYYIDNIYNNSNALKNIDTIERFFPKGINIFNLSDPMFNDLCIYIEENGQDVVLDDRIELYFQNYSICNSNCVISKINLKNYTYICKCSDTQVLSNDNLGKTKVIDEDSFSKETISEEISDIFFETNFEVLSCFIELLNLKVYSKNIGAIMTTIFLIIQTISGLFMFKQIKDIRLYLYKDIIKNLNPPKRRSTAAVKEEISKQLESGSNSYKNMIIINNQSPKDILKDYSSNEKISINKRKVKYDISSELSSRKKLINNVKSPKIFDNMIDEKMSNNYLFNNKLAKSGKINQPVKKIYPLPKNEQKLKEKEFPFFESDISSQRKIDKKNQENVYTPKYKIPRINKRSIIYFRKNYNKKYDENELKDYLYSQKTLPPKINEENNRYSKKAKNKKEFKVEKDYKEEKYYKDEKNNNKKSNLDDKDYKLDKQVNFESNKEVIKIALDKNKYDKKHVFSEYYAENTDRENKKEIDKDKPKIKLRRAKTKKSVDSRRRRTELGDNKKKENNNNSVQMPEKKEYDEDDLNEMDFDEAIIFDRRGFWELVWMEIKERQLIINTFFVKERLKPFSIKLIVFIFSITCYFVINGFLYDTKYVSKKLKRTTKSVYFFFVDSIKRIIYSSLVGALVNVLVGLLFRSDKTLRKAQVKYKDNRILLNGEVVRIFKNMKIINLIFTIVNFVLMIAVWIYLFCFCGVYRNCQLDWVESACIIIAVMQLLPVLISLLLSLLRIIGLRCGMESCFRITSWISDNT